MGSVKHGIQNTKKDSAVKHGTRKPKSDFDKRANKGDGRMSYKGDR